MEKIEKIFFIFCFIGLGLYSFDTVLREVPERNWDAVIAFSVVMFICVFGTGSLINGMIVKKKLAK